MSLYYPSCATPLPSYNCSPCPPSENGRVRSIAFVKTTYAWADPTSPTEWATAVASSNAIVLWATQGSYDMSVTEQAGWGNVPFTNGNGLHTLTYKDPNVTENIDFYNIARSTSDYTVIYRTSSRIWLAVQPVVITPKVPITDDLNSVVAAEVTVKWTSPLLPISYATPSGIFDRCYIV